ncbi:MAG TPA: glycosyltransferase family 39 protein [Acidobacteriaceae bacterium]|nr:glycosyltransferase family 39 protein [Acidobacteriaceae bacterium]
MASSTMLRAMARASAPAGWSQRFFLPAALVLLLLFALELYFSARTESQTFDEGAHLYAGYSYWLHRDYGVNPEHPPLVKELMALPLLLAKPAYPPPMNIYFRGASALGGVRLLAAPGGDALLGWARGVVALLGLALGVLLLLAGREMFGETAALIALLLFVFDPLILGHTPLLGTDVGATCFIFAAVYAFYRYVRRPSWLRLAVCGLAAGLALATKHSAVLLFPMLTLLCVAEVVLPAAAGEQRPSRLRQAGRLIGALLVTGVMGVAILWAVYGFRYAARPNGQQITPPSAAYLAQLHYPVEARAIGFAERHHLLPEAYLYGFTDITMLSREGREMFLFGKVYPNGRWFYFPSAFLIKSTIGFLLLLLIAPLARALWKHEHRRELLFLLIPAIAYFGGAMTSKLNIGLRHAMPPMPFLILLAAAGAAILLRQSRAWAGAVVALLVLHAASSAWAFPNYLPYSNEAFGGVNGTWRVLSDSNVGWGGGLKALHANLAGRGITECWFGYFAPASTAHFQIPCKRLPTTFDMLSAIPGPPLPQQIQGPVFISSEEIAGGFWGPETLSPYRQFIAMKPSRVIAGEILEYDGTFDVRPLAALHALVMAEGLLRQGKAQDALQLAQQSVALNPGWIYGEEMLIAAYAANGRRDDALREYARAKQIYAGLAPGWSKWVPPPTDPAAPPPAP